MSTREGLRNHPAPTPEGRKYQLEIVIKNRESLMKTMEQRIKMLDELMESITNYQTVKSELSSLDHDLQEFHNYCTRIKTFIETENVHEDELFVNTFDGKVFDAKTNALKWIRRYEESVQPSNNKSRKGSHRSSRSRSSGKKSNSNGSSRSSRSVKDTFMQEAAKMAALQAEAGFKSKLVELESQRKIASQKAKLDVYGQFLKSEEICSTTLNSPITFTLQNSPSNSTSNRPLCSTAPISSPITMTSSNASQIPSVSHPALSSRNVSSIVQSTQIMSLFESTFTPTLANSKTTVIPQAMVTHSTTSLTRSLPSHSYTPFQSVMTPLETSTSHKVVQCHEPPTSETIADPQPTLASIISSLLRMQSAPEPTIDIFYGDPLEFNYFISTFEEVIETKIDEDKGRLIRLIQFTGGEAKDLIKGCSLLHPTEGYQFAKDLLRKRFGDPYRVLASYRKEVQELSPIKNADATSLRSLFSFLVKSKYIIGNKFDTPDNICLVLTKLPVSMRDRWNRNAYQIRMSFHREPKFDDLIDFVDKETVLANDPLYSREAMSGDSRNDTSRRQAVRNFNTDLSKCLFCNEGHDIDICPDFEKLDRKEKGNWAMKSGRCFSCLKRGHLAKECNRPRKCEECGGKHPTSFHGYRKALSKPEDIHPEGSSETIESHAIRNDDFISMCTVPVSIKLNQNRVLTYALLDNCSQGTFIDSDLLSKLGSNFPETELSVRTLNGEEVSRAKVIEGLQVCGADQTGKWINLPKTYSRKEFSVCDKGQPITKQLLQKWPHLCPLKDKVAEIDSSHLVKVGILIGANCPKAIQPTKVIPSPVERGPYAFETNLGWCIAGPLDNIKSSYTSCFHLNYDVNSERKPTHTFVKQDQVADQSIERMIRSVYGKEQTINDKSLGDEFSQDDVKFLKIMDANCQKVNGHFILPLPFRNEKVSLPNNKALALKRLNLLKKKFIRNPTFRDDYVNFINNMLSKGYAQKVQSSYPDDEQWFIPHHGVYHPRKKKIRVVFDCSSKYHDKSLTDELIQGPTLTNQLLGVLTRFRQHTIATMADIESMLYQVRVLENQRRYLQFLWWEDGDSRNVVQEYEMCVHTFGSTSSPSCANYALRKAASEGESKYGREASDTLRRSFYVDDMLKSTEEPSKTIKLVQNVCSMCKDGGFNLTKVISNSRDVIESIPEDHRAKELQECLDVLPSDHALGVQWNLSEDTLSLRTRTFDIPITKRSLLSTIHQVYDPLGIAAPFLLESKRLLQSLCCENFGCDEEFSNELQQRVAKATETILSLQTISIPRCLHPAGFVVKEASLHHFSDASETGHGYCSYIRLQDPESTIHCSFVHGRSRVNPLKQSITMPRLELMAAALSSKLGSKLSTELEIPIQYEIYWTDSKVVLGYLNNESKKFKMFVSNRVTFIKDRTTPTSWRYVNSDDNPSDVGSRVLRQDDTERINMWLNGPKFLWQPLVNEVTAADFVVKEDDPEIVKISNTLICATIAAETNSFLSAIGNISCWLKIVRITAFMLRFINNCCKRSKKHAMLLRSQQQPVIQPLTVKELTDARLKIFQILQRSYFANTMHSLQNNEKIKQNDNLIRLDPFIHTDGLLRVGGRLQRSHMDFEIKHPIILPKDCIITKCLIRYHHSNTFHSGRGITINEIRSNGLWIININSMVRQVIYQCVLCRHLRGATIQQKMSDLPIDRIEAAPPFTYTGLDVFGPFYIKVRRSLVKRYGVLFTCLASRAVHIEAIHSMETDSFILSLRRLVARRGNVRMIRSDNGTNFVGADKQLYKEFMSMNHIKIADFLSKHNGDWVVWKRNPPHSSNFGGVWERHIRTARNILTGMLIEHGEILNEESFQTILTEVENVINSRPLSVANLNDSTSLKPISPMTLLTQKSKVVYPLPGSFSSADVYSRKYWRRVQHLVNEFWERWRKEYLNSLQERSKWQKEPKNAISINDVVLLKDEKPRNEWCLAKVTKLIPETGLTRTVEIELSNKSRLLRPLNKIVLLQKYDILK